MAVSRRAFKLAEGWSFALMCESLSFACPNERNPRKGHPVLRRGSASVPCAAPAASGPPETRRAARDSDIRRSLSLSAATARRRAQGARYRHDTAKPGSWPGCILSRYTETGSGDGCPARCAGAARCLRAAKAARVFAASRRREHRSEPALAGAVSGAFFLVPSLGHAKERTRTSVRNQSPGRRKKMPRRRHAKASLIIVVGLSAPNSCVGGLGARTVIRQPSLGTQGLSVGLSAARSSDLPLLSLT